MGISEGSQCSSHIAAPHVNMWTIVVLGKKNYHMWFFLHLHDIPILYIWKNPSNESLVDTYYSKVELWCIKSLYTSVTSWSYESLIYICHQRLSLLQLWVRFTSKLRCIRYTIDPVIIIVLSICMSSFISVIVIVFLKLNKGNNKITELRTILQRESLYKQTKPIDLTAMT
jgi:hypothetical protein